jgi:alpha-1,6-mannosyltransferase
VKIVDVSEFYSGAGGGVRTYTDAKLRAATARGHELVVVAPGTVDREEARHGGRVVWLACPRLPVDRRYGYFHAPAAVHAALARERPDVVEASSVWSGGLAVASYTGPGKRVMVFHQDPVAVYPHTLLDRFIEPARIDLLAGPYWRFLRRLSQRFHATVTAASWLAERLATFGVERVRAVDFGCSREPFASAAPCPQTRTQLLAATGTDPHGHVLVCVSRYHPEKRLLTLFEAVRIVRASRPVGLVVYGDGPLGPWIRRAARRTPGVHLAGFTRERAQLAQAIASADGLLHGSAAETFGLSVAEALWAGCPVVVPDRGGAAQLCRPELGETYTAGDAPACAAAILRLLARDRQALGLAARAHAAELVPDLDTHFARLFALYSAL